MLKDIKKRSEGFTIIEVLIVLAIAGLILLIVFLAVPALQRNNRNTQRRNDIATILGAVSEHVSNYNGQLPTTIGQVDDIANTGYYSGQGTGQGQMTLVAGTSLGTSALSATAANDRVVIVTGNKCSTTVGATSGGSSRQVAVQFLVETSSGFLPQCQDS